MRHCFRRWPDVLLRSMRILTLLQTLAHAAGVIAAGRIPALHFCSLEWQVHQRPADAG
jgi:hypothetical protein